MSQGPEKQHSAVAGGAVFSPCSKYRYRLHRKWSDGPYMLWIMLNPSTADEHKNDPTVERCQRRAVAGGFGGVLVGNIFALRSTDPSALYSHPDPVGPGNDDDLLSMAGEAKLIVCGWGMHGEHMGRGKQVMDMLTEVGHKPHALRLTRRGQPGHPLYVGYSVKPRRIDSFTENQP